eukprot:5165928-Lingulodinium_polyedra.AAC.1
MERGPVLVLPTPYQVWVAARARPFARWSAQLGRPMARARRCSAGKAVLDARAAEAVGKSIAGTVLDWHK